MDETVEVRLRHRDRVLICQSKSALGRKHEFAKSRFGVVEIQCRFFGSESELLNAHS